jgi:hypothetical protein
MSDPKNNEGRGTVYGVYVTDCRYEGGGVDAIFSTREKAREFIAAVVADERDEDEYRRRYDAASKRALKFDPQPWREEEPDVWGDSMSLVCIVEFEVDGRAPFLKLKEKRIDRWHVSPEECARE